MLFMIYARTRSYIIGLLLLMLAILPQAAAAQGCYLWLTNGAGESGTGTFIAYPGSLTGVFVSGCTFTGPFEASRLYVIKENGLNAAQMNGQTLVDVGASPNTLTSFVSCGYVDDELVYSVNGSTAAGGYDIVIDYGLDGRFTMGVDCILNEGAASAFTVQAYKPVVFPPAPGGGGSLDAATLGIASSLVTVHKKRAGKLAIDLQAMYASYKRGVLGLKALNFGMGLASGLAGSLGSVTARSVGTIIKKTRTSMNAMGGGAMAAADIAALTTIERYKSIERDPPRADFIKLAPIDSLTPPYRTQLTDSTTIYESQLQQLLSIEERLAAAELLTLERLQGAIAAPSTQGAVRQLENFRALTEIKLQLGAARKQRWLRFRRHLVNANLDGIIPVDSIAAIKNEILSSGFGGRYHKVYFNTFNISPSDIERMQQEVASINTTDLQGKLFTQVVDGFVGLEDSIRLRTTATLVETDSLLARIARVSPQPAASRFTLNGPDRISIGATQTYSLQLTAGTASSIQLGEYYTGATSTTASLPVRVREPGFYLVYCTLLNPQGISSIRYKLIEAVPQEVAPRIISLSPAAGQYVLPAGTQSRLFKVSATDTKGDPLTYRWFVNDVLMQESAADSFLLATATCQDNYFNVRLEVADTSLSSLSPAAMWDLNANASPMLCNNRPSRRNATYWYFGYNCGLKFGNNRPVPLLDGAFTNFEGASSMSDSAGKLLFYSNGITVWTAQHTIMQNGTGLLSDPSASQGAVIVPYPGQPSKYFLFTVGSAWGGSADFVYNLVDMREDSGRGAIVLKNNRIRRVNSEKISAVYHINQRNIWVLTLDKSLRTFFAYLITEGGFNPTPVISTFTAPIEPGDAGYMRISPNGRLIATADFNPTWHLFDFDPATGKVSNGRRFQSVTTAWNYGIEFSPNSRFVYVADHRGPNVITQYDLNRTNVADITSTAVKLPATLGALGGLQLGPDGRIYAAREALALGVIQFPNLQGLACQYQQDGQFLGGRRSSLGLPGFISSTLITNQIGYDGTCLGAPTRFRLDYDSINLVGSVQWQFINAGGQILGNATGTTPVFSFADSGHYNVRTIITWSQPIIRIDTLLTSVTITRSQLPVAVRAFGLNPNCSDSIQLSASRFGSSYQWQRNGADIPGATGLSYSAKETGRYGVRIENINSCPSQSDSSASFRVLNRPQPTILPAGNTLTTQSFSSYQWVYNGRDLPGVTTRTIPVQGFGLYQVRVTNTEGCTRTSAPFVIVSTIPKQSGAALQLIPNPTTGDVLLILPLAKPATPAQVNLLDMQGRLLWQADLIFSPEGVRLQWGTLPKGLYQIRVLTPQATWLERVVIQ